MSSISPQLVQDRPFLYLWMWDSVNAILLPRYSAAVPIALRHLPLL